uniref:MRC n=1 Tax=Panagrolaimus sp. ES5 TaxID=591445 RepID=A0AC34GVJ5_9BILA
MKILGDNNGCPTNYTLFGDGMCYQFLSEPVLRDLGKQKCELDGADLPKITDVLQNAIVTRISSDASAATWLGLTCSSNNNCIWDDGTKMSYNNFDSGFADTSFGSCVFINVGSAKKGKWSSTDCNADFKKVICQKSLPCPDSYIKGSDGRCYLSPNFKAKFNESENICKDTTSDSHLVSISCNEENDAVRIISQDAKFTNIFIGLHSTSNGYVWSDGTPYNYAKYNNFEDRQPNIRAGSCVAMNTKTGKWRSVSCNQQTSFVCLKKSTITPSTTTSTTPTTTSSPKTTTTQPYGTFNGSGTISSPGYPGFYPNNLTATYILQATPGKIVWITFNYFNTEKIYDTVTLYDGAYEDESKIITVLSGNQPTPQSFQSNGTFMTVKFKTDQSFAEDGGFTADFVSFDNSMSTKNCQNDWIHDSSLNYCYKYFSNAAPWNDSSAICSNYLGAKILTIHSSSQEFFIENLIFNAQSGRRNSSVWIGLRYLFLQLDDWGWSDGSYFGYKKWVSSAASSTANGECGAIQAFKNNNPNGWKAVQCNVALPYICYRYAETF